MRVAAILAVSLPASVGGQTVKPRLLVEVDTSGRMAWEACDPSAGVDVDESNDCPGADVACGACAPLGCGDGIPNDGRLWKVKQAVTDVVSAFGEAQFGLARFHGTPAPFACSGGGWTGGAAGCLGAPLGMDDNAANILVAFGDDNQQDLIEWLDLDDNYAGVPPATGCTLCPDCGGGCDKELRPTGATMLAGSLFTANTYLDGERGADPQAACRPYGVILIADGDNECLDPFNPADPDPTPEQASALCAEGVPVHVIGFASASIQVTLDAVADAGCDLACDDRDGDGLADGNCSDTAWRVDDEAALGAALSQIVWASIPDVVERCNGIDDDCDGLTDEEFATLGDPCDVGLCDGTVCCDASDPTQGSTTCCSPAPTCESCNCRDDDCDGITDNNIDVDCDGTIDSVICECNEVCNGLDDDGDGLTDELPMPGLGVPCGIFVGECSPGVTCCDRGVFSCCGMEAGTSETCNCKDDDCDGATDDDAGPACYTLGDACDPAAGTCRGNCQLGVASCLDLDPGPGCTAGIGPCDGQVGPRTETCNCIDDDCDGEVDEQVICSNGGCCESCGCPEPCDPDDQFPCAGGFFCDCDAACAGSFCFCSADPCEEASCGPCEVCPTGTGTCVPKCDSIECADWEVCSCDECRDVSCTGPEEFRCDEFEICDAKTHRCLSDPCALADCADGYGCRRDGTCGEDLCVPVCECPPDEACHCGRCEPDPCASVSCAPGRVCCAGRCMVDSCSDEGCAAGERCDPCSGLCEVDACLAVTCPAGTPCRLGECWLIVDPIPPPSTNLTSAGGGCACALAPLPAAPLWMGWVGLLAWRVVTGVALRKRRVRVGSDPGTVEAAPRGR